MAVVRGSLPTSALSRPPPDVGQRRGPGLLAGPRGAEQARAARGATAWIAEAPASDAERRHAVEDARVVGVVARRVAPVAGLSQRARAVRVADPPAPPVPKQPPLVSAQLGAVVQQGWPGCPQASHWDRPPITTQTSPALHEVPQQGCPAAPQFVPLPPPSKALTVPDSLPEDEPTASAIPPSPLTPTDPPQLVARKSTGVAKRIATRLTFTFRILPRLTVARGSASRPISCSSDRTRTRRCPVRRGGNRSCPCTGPAACGRRSRSTATGRTPDSPSRDPARGSPSRRRSCSLGGRRSADRRCSDRDSHTGRAGRSPSP